MEFGLEFASSEPREEAGEGQGLMEKAKAVVSELLNSDSLAALRAPLAGAGAALRSGAATVLGEVDTNQMAPVGATAQRRESSKSKAQARGERAYRAWKERQAAAKKGGKGAATAGAAGAVAGGPVLDCAHSAEYVGVVVPGAAPSPAAPPPPRRASRQAAAEGISSSSSTGAAHGDDAGASGHAAEAAEADGWRYKLKLPLWPVTLTLNLSLGDDEQPQQQLQEGQDAGNGAVATAGAAALCGDGGASHSAPAPPPPLNIPPLALAADVYGEKEACSSPAPPVPAMLAEQTNPLFDEAGGDEEGQQQQQQQQGQEDHASGSSSSSSGSSSNSHCQPDTQLLGPVASEEPVLLTDGPAATAAAAPSAQAAAPGADKAARGGGGGARSGSRRDEAAARSQQELRRSMQARAARFLPNVDEPLSGASTPRGSGWVLHGVGAVSGGGSSSGPSRQEREAFAALHGHAPHTWRLNPRTMRWEPVLLPPGGDGTEQRQQQQQQQQHGDRDGEEAAGAVNGGSKYCEQPGPANPDAATHGSVGGGGDDAVVRERDMLRRQVEELMAKMALLEGQQQQHMQQQHPAADVCEVAVAAGPDEEGRRQPTDNEPCAATPHKPAKPVDGAATVASPAASELSSAAGTRVCSPAAVRVEKVVGGARSPGIADAEGGTTVLGASACTRRGLSFFDNNLYLGSNALAAEDSEDGIGGDCGRGNGDGVGTDRGPVSTTPIISMSAKAMSLGLCNVGASASGEAAEDDVDEDWGLS